MKHSETAFVQPRADGGFDLRWFTPEVEVDLCGHATLASAHVLFETGRLAPDAAAVFHTRGGELRATREADGAVQLDFPTAPPEAVRRAGRAPRRARRREGRVAAHDGEFFMFVVPDAATVRELDARLPRAAARSPTCAAST